MREVFKKIFEKIKENIIGASIAMAGAVLAFMWSEIETRVASRVENMVISSIKAKEGPVRRAIAQSVIEELDGSGTEYRKKLSSLVDEQIRSRDEHSVGSIVTGTVVLSAEQLEQTIYVFLPEKNKGELWLEVLNTGGLPKSAWLATVAINNRLSRRIPTTGNWRIDLDVETKKLKQLPEIAGSTFDSAERGYAEKLPSATAAALYMNDLYGVTFRMARDDNTPGAKVIVKYMALVKPSIRLGPER
jgi:hypothetical protein